MLKTIYLNTAVYFYKLNYNFINITNYTEINVKIEYAGCEARYASEISQFVIYLI